MKPRVSVLMPVWNLAPYVAESIRSVLGQTFTDFEFLIQDGGSTDGTLAEIEPFLKDPRVRLTALTENEARDGRSGAVAATTALARQARGEYIALIAADDVWESGKLAAQVEALDANPGVSLCFAWPEFIDASGAAYTGTEINALRRVGNGPAWKARLLMGNAFFGSLAVYRNSVHAAEGYFDDTLHLLADLDFWHKCLRHGDLYVVQATLGKIRQRGADNICATTPANLIRHADELETVRERHRPKPHKFKLAIATPFYESRGWSPYIMSLVQSVAYMARTTKLDFDFWDLSGDAYVWRARNSLAHRLLESDFSHLMFIDSDMGWSLEAFQRVVSADVDIVGAAYPVKNNWEHYGVTIQSDAQGYPKVNEKWGTVLGESVPTGFMKINRTVFERIRRNEPENWYWAPVARGEPFRMHNWFGHLFEDHVAYGEDISFCRRAQRAGCELHVETRATMLHMGVQAWTGNYGEFLRKQPGGSESESPVAPEDRKAA